jgi:hypothetical protein
MASESSLMPFPPSAVPRCSPPEALLPAHLPTNEESSRANGKEATAEGITSTLSGRSQFDDKDGNVSESQSEPALKVRRQTNNLRLAIPQSAIFDLKTRNFKTLNPIFDPQVHSRAWINQTPNFVLAEHLYGKFTNEAIRIQDLSENIQQWETENEDVVRGLIQVIKKLSEITASREDKRVEVRREGLGDLQIWTTAVQPYDEAKEGVLPSDVAGAWKGKPEARETVLRDMG